METSFESISYNNGTLKINNQEYNIDASGNNVVGNSFSQIKIKENKLIIDGTEITFTEYTTYITDINGNILQDINGNNLLYL